MENRKQIEVTLKDPINIAVKGEHQECDTVLLIAPASKHRAQASRIKNFCAYHVDKHLEAKRAQLDSGRLEAAAERKAEAESEGDDSGGFEASTLMAILALVEVDDENAFETLYNLFQKMLEKGCGSINGTEITKHVFDKFSFQDLENLFGEYVVSFLLDSLMN